MNYFNENFATLNSFQNQGLEPARNFAAAAVDTFEQIARKNYAFCGDVLEFAVSQAKLPVDVAEPKELFERQVASSKAFAELLGTRANEYVELGKAFQDKVANVADVDVAEPAKAKPTRTRKKAAA